jgi:hypothetical protein
MIKITPPHPRRARGPAPDSGRPRIGLKAASAAGFQRRSILLCCASATSKLRPKIRALDLIELLNSAPSFVAHRTRDVDL